MKTWLKLKNNPKLWQRYFIREKVIQLIREFFIKENFHEIETPHLVPSVIPESYLEYFSTDLIDRLGKKKKMFLATSPEASIKKLLAAGIGNCFSICKSFRNSETGSSLHNPEFTILEWYRVGANYMDLMKDCERLINFISKNIKKQISRPKDDRPLAENIKNTNKKLNIYDNTIIYQGKRINLSSPWERISVVEAFKKYAKFDLLSCLGNRNKLAEIARRKDYNVDSNYTWEQLFNLIFLNELEPHLGEHGKPAIIYDYPAELAALAKLKKTDTRLAERFELYIGGLELADCYTELTDYNEQAKRFNEEVRIRAKLGKMKVKLDLDFLKALKIGLPECSGIAMGVDRLAMIFTDSRSIDETLLFPIKDLI